ncbi:MAG TPA: SPFH domain-containing protein, partial [Spirochaetia bacterium]|nr:SPFH domain-containing protein [Spirochaetia bacterium]
YVDYVGRRKKLHGSLFETALPNEYLVEIGRKKVSIQLGGRRFRLFKKFIRIPASVQTLRFSTDNANQDYQGIGIEGYANWRIDPAHPETAIHTLDFFDENDPMARTNAGLRTICVEAVRHVISNMGVDDALKKKDTIAARLRSQLEEVERTWGIIFDQVGIEKVRIMSSRLFEQLQSQFRDGLRLEVERKRIATDREINHESNSVRELSGLEKLGTDEKLNLAQVESHSHVEESELSEKHRLAQRQRELEGEAFRSEVELREEKERKESELSELKQQLELALARSEVSLLEARTAVSHLQAGLDVERLGTQRLEREVTQTWSNEELMSELIRRLPEALGSIKIDSYNVLASGGEQSSPLTRMIMEVAAVLKTVNLSEVLRGHQESHPERE